MTKQADSLVNDNVGDALPKKISVATRLVELAGELYELGCTPDGESYAMPKTGPKIVRQLRGGRHSLRSDLAARYYAETGAAASQSALSDACAVIEGQAQQVEPVELHPRVASHDGGIVLDLGDMTGRCVFVCPTGWWVLPRPPDEVRFRRTALTAALPEPVEGDGFDPLWTAVNVAERYRPVVLGFLVAALFPDMPHALALLTGEQGTGKSTATARLAAVIDPSTAQLRKAPRDDEQWVIAASGSWVVPLDNLSGVSDWLSDSLCRASTGDGNVRRQLYTNEGLVVFAYRRVVLLNGIDLGGLRGDLVDRLVHLQLDRIPEDERRTDAEMRKEWAAAHPAVLGALLELSTKVLAVLPSVELENMPRMADFARVLAAVDDVLGTDGLTTYLNLREELAADAGTSDPVLVALTKTITTEWQGTSAELLDEISPSFWESPGSGGRPGKDWPTTARQLTTALTRQAPTLRTLGWAVTKDDRDATRDRVLRWTLVPPSCGNGSGTPRDAAPDAAPPSPPLNSGNEDHAASAATAASFAPSLCSLRMKDKGDKQRSSANDAAMPRLPHALALAQVNGGANPAASSAASARQSATYQLNEEQNNILAKLMDATPSRIGQAS